MKKTLVAMAALAAVSAFAQSSVTLYGQIGAAFGSVKTTAVENNVSPAGVITPGLNNSISSSGMRANDISGSRWGFRGTEDLGGGMRATFNLESGFNANDGTGFGGGGSIFSRRSVVGLGGGFGEVSFGRELTPAVFLAGGYDVDGIETFSTTRHLAQGVNGTAANGVVTNLNTFRRSNSINYVSNDLGGIVVRAQFAANSNKTANNLTGGNTATSKPTDSGFGLSVNYANGPLGVGFALDQGKGVVSTTAPSTNLGSKFNGFYLGGSYDLGSVKLLANLSQVKAQSITTPDVGDSITTKQWNIGAQIPMGALTFMASLGRNNLSGTDGIVNGGRFKASGTDFMVGANYALSKRTTTYVRAGAIDKFSGNESFAGVRTGTIANKTSGVAIGVRHTF